MILSQNLTTSTKILLDKIINVIIKEKSNGELVWQTLY